MLMADKVIAVSTQTKKAIIREYHIPSDKIDVVHNSIDKNWYESLDDKNSYKYLEKMKNNGYKVVVNIGRITVQKGLFNLLMAAKEVVKRKPKTIFLIVGSGEQEYELLELSAQLGISQNVIFTGFQRGKNLRDAFSIGNLFVMPSVSEPFGLTPLEAIGYGTPSLISKQYKGNPWIVCSMWLAQYYIGQNKIDQAKELINWALSTKLSSGVLSEQFDVSSGKHVGVTPLVWSHAELVKTFIDLYKI